MAAWSIVTTVVFGVLNLIQWVQQDRSAHRVGARGVQLEGIKVALAQLNYMCNDAEKKGDAEEPKAMKRFISDIACQAKVIENQVDIMLGNLRLAPGKPQSRFRRIMGYIFPATRI